MIETIVIDDDGAERAVSFPAKWEICGTCHGDGSHSRGLGAFTSSDIDELGEEWLDDYRAGRFDSVCESCSGAGKVKVIDEAAAKGRGMADDLERWLAGEAEIAEMEAIERAERRFGC